MLQMQASEMGIFAIEPLRVIYSYAWNTVTR